MSAGPTQRILPLGARVQCTDGHGGSVIRLIVEPLARRLTHIVVQDDTVPAVEHLVPAARIAETTHDLVTLDCTQDTLMAIEPYPFAEFEADHIPLVTEHIPPGELAIRRGAQVVAIDGHAGELTAFVVDRASGRISSIVVQLGHWLTKHEQAIPIATVEGIDSDTLYLTLAREEIAALPVMPPRRHYD